MARSIRQNIIISFVAFSLISLVLVGAISIVFIGLIGQTTIDSSSNAFKDQIQDNIIQTAEQNALIINRKLSNAESMVNAMAEECENLFEPDSPFEYRRSYYDYFFEFERNLELFPNDTYLDAKYGVYLSWSVASWYIPNSNSTNYLQLLAADSNLNDTVSRVANMDHIFQAVHENAPEIRWLYIAFEGSNLFINYPGSVVGGTNTDRITDPFVATAEDWYTDVRNGNGEIVFTAPYFDPIDGALLITIGKAIYVQKTLMGCIFADITIESIKDKILDIDILQTGYAVLIQESGLIVAHPEWTAPTQFVDLPTIDEVEVNSNGLSALTQAQMTVITAGSTGVIEYSRDDQDRYLAYTPVGKGDYICLIVVPVSEAVASVGVLEQRIDAQTVTTIVQAVLIIVLAVIISLTIGIWISNRIIRPITHLTQIASKMATDQVREDLLGELDLQIDSQLEQQDDEVGDLTRAFKGMLFALKDESKKGKEKLDDSFWEE
ncbi:MAG: cache and HAMP domain-containing protein [Candidatus Heimdallarchaeota archaeon]|nr:MAG: cache and HAMP domain-containing protein [Candidatus Heimdallarchaeota archaeon]